MRLRAKLQLGSLTALLFGMFVLTGVLLTNKKVDRLIDESRAYGSLVHQVFGLDKVLDDYLSYPDSARARHQSQIVYGSLGDFLNKIGTFHYYNSPAIKSLFESYLRLEPLLTRLAAHQNSTEATFDYYEQREILSDQLSINLASMIAQASNALEVSQLNIIAAQRRAGNITALLLIALIMTNGVIFLLLYGRFRKSLLELYEGTKIIGSGNLAHRIVARSNDEIGQLGQAFNEMAHKLSSSYAALEVEISERKRAEEEVKEINETLEQRVAERTAELAASEERLRRSQEIAHLGSWELDLASNSLSWSDEVYRIFGLEPQEFDATYEAFLDAIHPDDRAAVDAGFVASVREGRNAYEIEHRVVRKSDGEVRIVHEKCDHFRDDSGRVRSIGMVQDITGQKRAEARIRQQNSILETINLILYNALTCETEEQLGMACLEALENLTQSKLSFVDEVGSDGLVRFIAVSNCGLEQCSMLDKNCKRRPLGNFGVRGLYDSVLREGKSLLTNDPYLHPDSIGTAEGHPRLTAFLGVPLTQERKTIGMIGLANREGGYTQEHILAVEAIAPAMLEVLLRKRAEQDLRAGELRFKLLSETAGRLLESENPQKIVNELCQKVMEHLDCQAFFNFLVDLDAGKLRLNACAGIPDEEVQKIEWLDYGVAVCGCAARDAVRIVADDIFNTPDFRTDLVKSFGVQAYACHPLMAQGQVVGTLSFGAKTRTSFSSDDLALMKTVADQVAIAMERMSLIHELRRSRDELELRVLERTAELEQSNQALQEFASIASHDMKEPLRKVIAFGNLLRQKCEDSLTPTGNDYLNRMIDATERMQTLITSLLEYSRVTTNAEPFREVDLYDIVHEVLSDLEVRIERTEGEVQIGVLPTVEGDPTQMRQLFQNLIGNALKFHKEGERPLVRIWSTTGESGSQVFIEDNGIGFEDQYIAKIFQPFQRLHGRSSRYEGSGMGLAICRKIVERHHGSITARSIPERGATFIIHLPTIRAQIETE